MSQKKKYMDNQSQKNKSVLKQQSLKSAKHNEIGAQDLDGGQNNQRRKRSSRIQYQRKKQQQVYKEKLKKQKIQQKKLDKQKKLEIDEERLQRLQRCEFKDFFRSFYDKASYHRKKYKQKMSKFSLYLMKDQNQQLLDIENAICKNKIKLVLFQIYKGSLQHALSDNQQNYQDLKVLKQSFKLIKEYIDQLISDGLNNIYFPAFSFEKPQEGDIVLEFVLKRLFEVCLDAVKKLQDQKKIIPEKLTDPLEHNIYQLTALTIRQSYVHYSEKIISQLHEMVQIFQQSWYLRHILFQFLNGRQRAINFQNKKQKQKWVDITEQLIKQKISELKVIFVDYSNKGIQGKTYSKGCDNNIFPIIINMFSTFQDRSLNYISSYCMFVIIHEIGHQMIRKIGVIQDCDSSFPKNEFIQQDTEVFIENLQNKKEPKERKNQQKEDGGWLFQKFAFGGRVNVFFQNDYKQIKKLLQIKQNPDPECQNWDFLNNKQKCKNFVYSQDKYQRIQERLKNVSFNSTNIITQNILSQSQIKQVNNQMNNIQTEIKELTKNTQKSPSESLKHKYRNSIRQFLTESQDQEDSSQIQAKKVSQFSQVKELIMKFQTFGLRKISNVKTKGYLLRTSPEQNDFYSLEGPRHGNWIVYSQKNSMMHIVKSQIQYERKQRLQNDQNEQEYQ